MKKLISNIIILHTILFVGTGVGIWLILTYFFPNMQLDGYALIPLFFYVLGLLFIVFLRRSALKESKKTVNTFMMFRVIKVVAILMILIAYWLIDKQNIRSFAIVFLMFYLIHLMWETYIFTQIEKYIKFKMEQNKPPAEQIDSDVVEN